MPSPFPGMDPYFETPAVWSDFHARFITCWGDALVATLPASYDARIEERVRLVAVSVGTADVVVRPDIAVEKARGPSRPAGESADEPSAGVATLEPVSVLLPVFEEVREKRIEIVQLPGRELVAVLELLSPWNKVGEGHENYLAKRTEVLCRPVHLVEVDLLTRGQRLPLQSPLPSGDYYALVSRADRRPWCEVYAWGVRQPLPTVPVPLKSPDRDVRVELAAVFNVAFDRGRYRRILDYAAAVPADLQPDDAAWAAGIAKPAAGAA